MEPERLVQDALDEAGDPAGAFLWRRVCRDLDGDLAIGIAARDDDVGARLGRRISRIERVEVAALRIEEHDDTPRPTLGSLERLFGLHAFVWATPAAAALGGEERAALRAFVRAGAPERRVVVIVDVGLLDGMTDDPDRELEEVVERARTLAGPAFQVLTEKEVRAWIEQARTDRVELASERRRAVAGSLLRDARKRANQAVTQADAELARVEALLAAEDQALEAERVRGRRTAGHLLAAVRRNTEQLLLDLREFLVVLEGDLPRQIEAVPDVATIRHTLPHWLHHVVGAWMIDRLARWRVDVLADLAEIRLDEGAIERAELLVPALFPSPVRGDPAWGQRIGVTAAVGGGAALLLFGLWVPGLLALGGGIVWSALGRSAAMAHTRRALTDAAIDAVRRMGADGDRLLRDQISALQDELERLGDDRADALRKGRTDTRAALEAERQLRRQRREALDEIRVGLDRRISAIHT
jgi:hypothetical protein